MATTRSSAATQAIEWFDLARRRQVAVALRPEEARKPQRPLYPRGRRCAAGRAGRRDRLGHGDDAVARCCTRAMPVAEAARRQSERTGRRRRLPVRDPPAGDRRPPRADLLAGEAPAILARAHAALDAVHHWDTEALEAAVRQVAETAGVKLGQVAQPLRAALTGRRTSPGIFDVLVLLGRDESLGRIADQMAGLTGRTTDMTDTAKLSLDGKEFDYPVMSGTVGPDVVDIRKLYAQTGAFTYDPGFTSTASCQSKLTYIDGDEGVLLHRGYAIGELAEQSSFMEVALSAAERRTADAGRARHVHLHDHAATRWCTSSSRPSIAGSAATRIRWRSCAASSARCQRLLSRFDRHPRSAAAHDRVAPPDRQDADDRGDGVQVQRRPAVPLSRQFAELHRQFPADDLRRSGRAL